ncbi:hypothetical protein [Ruegeria sp. Ofav3-42]|uniref:hypothetical protein n=1 Tax=Ruegeria sp. Ofav3-42 TaxID=2917759 RepID=UPI001EF62406|nr:hypothetical protein [Ruegeria sp. Ofav3-42]MCG7521520.1 hypothetical protein [Ruegeria sp. Ofav3-42]
MRQVVMYFAQRLATVAVGWIGAQVMLTADQQHALGAALIAIILFYFDAAIDWYKGRSN